MVSTAAPVTACTLVADHLVTMTILHKQGRYDRMSEDFQALTGRQPMGMREFEKQHASAFTPVAA